MNKWVAVQFEASNEWCLQYGGILCTGILGKAEAEKAAEQFNTLDVVPRLALRHVEAVLHNVQAQRPFGYTDKRVEAALIGALREQLPNMITEMSRQVIVADVLDRLKDGGAHA